MDEPKVLIVPDDLLTQAELKEALGTDLGRTVATALEAAADRLRAERFPLLLLDLDRLFALAEPDHVFGRLADIRRRNTATKVIALVPEGGRSAAAEALRLGASDVLLKPLDAGLLRILVRRARWIYDLEQHQAPAASPPEEDEEMVGTSDGIRRVFAMIRKVATTDVPVLITGESGTGKELTAKAIHERSPRARGPFVTINCGAIPETLLESELFGHEKGSFTGALQQRKGKVEYAQGGTVFLDEVGELPMGLQVKMLRFLQDRTIERIGGRHSIALDARIIAATHVDLAAAIVQGKFRQDLFYRLGVVNIHVPPLRERGEDALLMARVFLRLASAQTGKRMHGFTKEGLDAIRTYSWPGNVRELLNKIRRAVVMAEGPYITPEDLDLPFGRPLALAPQASLREAKRRHEAELLAQGLALHNGNLSRVAEELRISRPTLYKLLHKHGLKKNRASA